MVVIRRLLLSLLLLAACAPTEGGDGTCSELWCACPGQEPYRVAESATDLRTEMHGDVLYFSYYNCKLGRRTITLNVSAACALY